MSRDLKRPQSTSGKRSPARKAGGGTLIGIIIGLVLGVCAALAVVLYINKAPMPFVDKTQPPPKDAKETAGNLAAAKPGTPAPTQAPAAGPAPQAAAPAPAPAQQPAYWYYCRSAKAYYPYVKNCPEGWQAVQPQPPAP